MLRYARPALVVWLAVAFEAVAQDHAAQFTLRGVVVGPESQPLAGVSVQVSNVGHELLTDSLGRFSLARLEPRRYSISFRRVGFAPFDTVLTLSEALQQLRVSLRRVATLESVRVNAAVTRVPGFDERRALGIGQFITRDALERQSNRRVGDILASVPGVRVYRGKGYAWIAAGRGVSTFQNPTLDKSDLERGARPQCYVNVYLDGAMVYSSSPNAPLFDVNSLSASEIEAIEYYSGAGQIPARYNRTNASCGVLLIWTRR